CARGRAPRAQRWQEWVPPAPRTARRTLRGPRLACHVLRIVIRELSRGSWATFRPQRLRPDLDLHHPSSSSTRVTVEYNPTSRAINIHMYRTPVVDSSMASIRATRDTGAMSP